ncbi:MAG: tetratricopeptide repeat protein [Planctomycetaceae bacterium]
MPNNLGQNLANRNLNLGSIQNYPNHWNPYQHSNWNVGYWNTGYNLGYGRNAFGSGYGVGPYGPYGAYGPYGYGLGYGGYGLGYGPYGYGYGPYGYYGRGWGALAAIGLTSWVLGSAFYGLGYGNYGNPYYASSYGGYNYAQPIPAAYASSDPGDTTAPSSTSTNDANAQAADRLLTSARSEFRSGNYEEALKQIDQAITQTPGDTVLHEFRALTLFALHKYPEASATIYAVLSVAPGWNWSTMAGLYPSVAVYTEQLRTLEQEAKANPNEAAIHFLLGYHYLTMGHADAARKQLEMAAKLSTDDRVAKQLLQLLAQPQTSEDASGSNATKAPSPPQTPSAEPSTAPPSQLVGDWQAKAQGNGSISLALKDDGTFVWTFVQDGKPIKHEGRYELQGDTLIFDMKDGGGLIGKFTEQDQGFHFAILNGPPSDPGLDFRRT